MSATRNGPIGMPAASVMCASSSSAEMPVSSW